MKTFFKMIKYETIRVARNKVVLTMLLTFSIVLLMILSFVQMDTKNYPIAIYTDGVEKLQCSRIYTKEITEPEIKANFCDCNSLGIVLVNKGKTTELCNHSKADITSEIIEDFDYLSTSFANYMSDYEIPSELHEWQVLSSSENYNAFNNFYNKAKDLYNNANNDIVGNVDSVLSSSAIMGINKPYLIKTQESSSLSYSELQIAVSRLFGYKNTSTFTQYSQKLVNEYLTNSAGSSNDTLENRIKYDGSIYTNNGSFILPLVFKTDDITSLTYVIVDNLGNMSIWIDDVSKIFQITNTQHAVYNSEITESEMNISSYGRCTLFETPSIMNLGLVDVIGEKVSLNNITYVNNKEKGIDMLKRNDICFFICLKAGETVEETTAVFYYDETNIVGRTVKNNLSSAKNEYAYQTITNFLEKYGITLNQSYFNLVEFETTHSKKADYKQISFTMEVGTCVSVVLMFGLAYSMSRDNETSISKNLSYMPVGPNRYLMSKVVPYYLLGTAQMSILLLIGFIFFKIHYQVNFLLLLFVASIFVLSVICLSLIFSTLKSQIATIFSDMLTIILPLFILTMIYVPATPVIVQIILYCFPIVPFVSVMNAMMFNGIILWWQVAILLLQSIVYYLIAMIIMKIKVKE